MKKYLGGILFIVLSLVILSGGIFLNNISSSKNYEKITGIISEIIVDESFSQEDNEIKTNTIFYVNYNYNGKLYENVRLNYSDSLHKVGDKIDFYVNVEDPNEITINPHTALIISLCLSAGFLIMGIIVVIKVKKSSNY